MQRVLRNQVICPRAECLLEVPLHILFCKLGGEGLHEKKVFQADHFVPLIQFYKQSRKRKKFYKTCRLKQKNVKLMLKACSTATLFKN